MIRRILIGLIIAVLSPIPALAQTTPLTANHLAVIRENCQTAQLSIRQLQKSDAVSRVNYGRAYENIDRQVSALNSRFAYNEVEVSQLQQSASDFKSAVDRFKASYNRYSDQATDAVKVDCDAKPEQFYRLLQNARQDRTTVTSDLAEITQILVDYRAAVARYQQETFTTEAP